MAYRFINGTTANPMCELGWKSLGVLELTALPGISKEVWTAAVQETDALLVFGGDVVYLSRWMQESGLSDLMPSLRETVYVGISAGSMVTAPVFGETYDDPETSLKPSCPVLRNFRCGVRLAQGWPEVQATPAVRLPAAGLT